MGNLFKNYRSPGKTKTKDVVKQQKPAVGVFPWIPQRHINSLRQPHEKGKFFAQKSTGTATDPASGPVNSPTVLKLFPTNPVAIGLSSVQITLDNGNRDEIQITNVGTSKIYLGLGRVPTLTNYDQPLAACAVANDGTGGEWISDSWKGSIYAISDSAAGSLVMKETP
jgi:hypothetical protein